MQPLWLLEAFEAWLLERQSALQGMLAALAAATQAGGLSQGQPALLLTAGISVTVLGCCWAAVEERIAALMSCRHTYIHLHRRSGHVHVQVSQNDMHNQQGLKPNGCSILTNNMSKCSSINLC